jgi:iron complex transport system substrate-binding protein
MLFSKKSYAYRKGRFRKSDALLLVLVNFALIWLLFPSDLPAKTVSDQLGRAIEIPESPKRIVSLAPSITEIVYFIGKEDLLVGVSRFSDYPEAAQELPKVGSYVQLDLERIVALEPDLCIAIKDGNPKDVVDRLENLGIPVYAVNPQSLETVTEAIRTLGSLLDTEAHAETLATGLEDRIARIDDKVGSVAARPGIFFQIGVAPIVSAGAGTFINEIIERAGGRNLAAGATGYPRFSREQVIGFAPDIIIITSMARGKIFEAVRDEWMAWEEMPAVRDNRVYIQESDLFDRPSPRLVDGLEQLARLIHPEFFEEAP